VAEELRDTIPDDLLGDRFTFAHKEECYLFADELQKQYVFAFDFGVLIFWNFALFQERDITARFA